MVGLTSFLEEHSPMTEFWQAIAGLGTLVLGRGIGTWEQRRRAEKEDRESNAKMLRETQDFIFSSMQNDIVKLKERRDKDEARIDGLISEVSELKRNVSDLSVKNNELIQERDSLRAAIIDLKDRLAKVKSTGTKLAVNLQKQIEFARAEIARVTALYREATGNDIPEPEPSTPEEEKIRARLAEERIAKKMVEEYLNDKS